MTRKVDPGTGLPLNPDGTVTVYHYTSPQAAKEIRRTGRLRAAGEPDVYVTTENEPVEYSARGYGSSQVAVNVDPSKLELDDEFPSGRQDFRISVGRPSGSLPVRFPQKKRKPMSKHSPRRSRPNRANKSTCEYGVFADKRGKFDPSSGLVSPSRAKAGDLLGTAASLRGRFSAQKLAEAMAKKLGPGRAVHVFQYCGATRPSRAGGSLPDRVMSCKARTSGEVYCVVRHRQKRRKKLKRPATQARALRGARRRRKR